MHPLSRRTQDKFTLAGPEDISQLRSSQEPFVHPGYAELNQSYEQATNSELALEFGQTTATCGAVRHGANQAGSPGESPKPQAASPELAEPQARCQPQ